MKFVTVKQMVAVEQAADLAGHSYAAMMEQAGRGLAELVQARFGENKTLLALVGKGNNGGDALVAASFLQSRGWDCTALLVDRAPDLLVERAEQAGCTIANWDSIDPPAWASRRRDAGVLLDGLLGTGIHLPLRGPVQEALTFWKSQLPVPGAIVAVDCPSGVDCDSGDAAAETLPADLTVTMAAPKIGLFQFPAAGLVGDLEVVGIGLPSGLPEWGRIRRRILDASWVGGALPRRPADAHKGTFGTVAVVAGSENYVGAAMLAGMAAFRSGAGLVMMACPGNVYRLLAGHFPESTWLPLPDSGGALSPVGSTLLRLHLDRATAVLLGPGLGLADSTAQFVSDFLKEADRLPPLVVDADGLKLLARIPNWQERLPPDSVLTPHPGEMSVLTGLPTSEIQSSRLQVAEEWAGRWGVVVVLKGAHTLISAPDRETAMVPIASAALARAGTGDVLAGLVAGLRGQGMAAFEAAAAGAWVHGRAGLQALESVGSSAAVLAGDVLDSIGPVLGELEADS